MDRSKQYYVTTKSDMAKVMRTEILFAPLLVVLPVVFAVLLLVHWFSEGFSPGSAVYDGELLLAIIILVGNIVFDIPFLRSLIKYRRK